MNGEYWLQGLLGLPQGKYQAHSGHKAVYQIGEVSKFGAICYSIWNNPKGSPSAIS